MRSTTIAAAVALALLAGACGTDDPSVTASQRGRPVVVTALRPLAEAIERMAGDEVVVIDLNPVGEAAHDLALTDGQRAEVLGADLAVVLGRGFQPELEAAAAERDGETLVLLDAVRVPDRPGGAEGPPDPHIWLDPTIMGSVVTAIAHAVARVAPDDASAISARAQKLVEEYVILDAQITQGLRECARTVIASQHEAFGWFGARYGFTNVGLDGVLPDADPAPDVEHQAAMEALIDDGSVRTLFIDPMAPSSWLEVIADERGLETEVLNPYEGVHLRSTKSDRRYRSVMLNNTQALREQLDCGTG